MPRLLPLLAARTGSLLNMAEVSRATGIAHSTLRRHLTLLEALFIVQPLPAWSANLGKRVVKAPKLHVIDAGLALQPICRAALIPPRWRCHRSWAPCWKTSPCRRSGAACAAPKRRPRPGTSVPQRGERST